MIALPETHPLELQLTDRTVVQAVDDPFSDRVRCDHPETTDGDALAEALLDAAEDRGRGRIVALVPARLAPALERAEFAVEATMPGFYQGEEDCAVMGHYLDVTRETLANPKEAQRVDQIVDAARAPRSHAPVETRLALASDADRIAELLDETFKNYPTPSNDPAYVAKQIREGTPFRIIEDDGQVVACASADLVRDAKTAELTDCATRPSHRGRGLMQFILTDLVTDLTEMGYPTAYTMARARIPGMNLAFKRLGFEFRGRMRQSVRIGDGIEDMNVWSQRLVG